MKLLAKDIQKDHTSVRCGVVIGAFGLVDWVDVAPLVPNRFSFFTAYLENHVVKCCEHVLLFLLHPYGRFLVRPCLVPLHELVWSSDTSSQSRREWGGLPSHRFVDDHCIVSSHSDGEHICSKGPGKV